MNKCIKWNMQTKNIYILLFIRYSGIHDKKEIHSVCTDCIYNKTYILSKDFIHYIVVVCIIIIIIVDSVNIENY